MPGIEGGKRSPEQELPPYVDARRYPHQEAAARAYQEGQQALKKEAGKIDVSLYRIMYGPDFASHVVALGKTPPQHFQDKLEVAFGGGERVTLPDDVVQHLVARRSAASVTAPWVEGHYRPGQPVWTKRRGRHK